MALGIYGKQIQLNPELEALRDKALHEERQPDIDDVATQLIEKTSSIHGSFLFEERKTLQLLCVLLCESSNTIEDSGWESFAHNLGISVSRIKVIQHQNINNQDPAYNTLLTFIQHNEATIGKIIHALRCMGRLDVITRLSVEINELADRVLSQYGNLNGAHSDEASDYGSLFSSEGRSSSDHNVVRDEIIRPPYIEPAPFILSNIDSTPPIATLHNELGTPWHNMSHVQSTASCHVNSLPTHLANSMRTQELYVCKTNKRRSTEDIVKPLGVKKEYGKKVLLTFAEDGEEFAEKITAKFRRERENHKRIGVVVLQEHQDLVNSDPHEFINAAFYQVDYVCPILTEGYLKMIARKETVPCSTQHLDAKYVLYIFNLMNNYYVSNGCLNDKVRCIIPDDVVSSIQNNLLLSGPILAAWVRSSEVDDLAVKFLESICR